MNSNEEHRIALIAGRAKGNTKKEVNTKYAKKTQKAKTETSHNKHGKG